MKILSLTLLLLCSACIAQTPRQEVSAQPTPTAGAAVLYARDGTPVWNAGTSGPNQRNGPAGEATNQDGSRMYLLDLYQKAIDEREALSLEIKSMGATLERAQIELGAAQQAQATQAQQITSLQNELEQARSQNFELAARLVTAQIRRLEAEKMLLETKIEAARLGSSSTDQSLDTVGTVGASSAKKEPR